MNLGEEIQPNRVLQWGRDAGILVASSLFLLGVPDLRVLTGDLPLVLFHTAMILLLFLAVVDLALRLFRVRTAQAYLGVALLQVAASILVVWTWPMTALAILGVNVLVVLTMEPGRKDEPSIPS